MAITTVSGAISGLQYPQLFAKQTGSTIAVGVLFSYWGVAGLPSSGNYDGTLNGVSLSAPQVGQIPFTNPASGNTYLGRLSAATIAAPSKLILADRLWHNGGIDVTNTGSQAITSPTLPARDANGATNGDGVLIGVEISSTVGAGTPTITVGYTNSSGTSGRSATNVVATTANSKINNFYPIGLQAGDTGVQSVQSITLSATWTSGTINLVAYRPIAELELEMAGVSFSIDAVTGNMPRFYNSSVPFLLAQPTTTSTVAGIAGSVLYTQG